MPAPWGITATGFNCPSLSDIISELNTEYLSMFGNGTITTPDSILGKIIAIQADREFSLWQAQQSAYNATRPSTAQGTNLDDVSSITGVTRNPAISSTGVVYLAGTGGTVIPALSVVGVQGTNAAFQILSSTTLSAVGTKTISSITRVSNTATVTCTAHGCSTNDVVFIYGADQTDYNILAKITVTDANHFTYTVANTPVTPATGALIQFDFGTPANVSSILKDAIIGVAGTINIIVTPVANWTKVQNLLDAQVGHLQESDNAFRARRIAALLGIGNATIPAIGGDMSDVLNVTSVIVFENVGDVVDGFGRPPHCVEVVVVGGLPQDIGNAIFATVAGGIATYGNQSPVTVIDEYGLSHSIPYSLPSPVPIYVIVNITSNSDFIAGSDVTVKNQIAAYGNALGIGQDVVVLPYLASAIANIPGIQQATIFIGIAPSPGTSNTIVIGQTQQATFNIANITVNVT